MPSSLSSFPTIQKLIDYLAGLGASPSILEHVRESWDIEVKARRQGGADIYWLAPGHPGRFSSMVKAAEALGLQPPKRARPVMHVVEETDSDEGYKQPPQPDFYAWDGADRPRPKRQTRPPQRTSMDLPLRVPRGRSLPPPSSPPSLGPPSALPTPLYPAAPTAPSSSYNPYPHLNPSMSHLHYAPRPLAPQPAAHQAPPVGLHPVMLELEPVEQCAGGGADAGAHFLAEGAPVEWVASFILHARKNHVRLIDRSGLVLAHQNAFSLQYVVEGGCLRILPLLEQEPPEGWASLPIATPADQLGTVFDSEPAYTGASVTSLLRPAQLAGAESAEDDEWALLDLRVPVGRLAGVRPDGGLSLLDECVLPATLAQPQHAAHVHLQPQQPGHEGPGVEMVFHPLEAMLESNRQQALLVQQQQQEEQHRQELERQQQAQRMQQLEELQRHREQMEELQKQRQHLERLQQALQQQAAQQAAQIEQQQQQQGALVLGGMLAAASEQQGFPQGLEGLEFREDGLQMQEGEAGQGMQPSEQQQQQQDEMETEGGMEDVQDMEQDQLVAHQASGAAKRGGPRVWGRQQGNAVPVLLKPQVLPDNFLGGSPNATSSVPRKSCNCKKSRCLKLYCECFAAGLYCDNCCCLQCLNNPESEPKRQQAMDFVLEKNPLAFQSKIQEEVVVPDETAPTAAADVMGKHRKGCTCKKSACLKKYCECFQAGVFCSESCRCTECKNYEGAEHHAAVRSGTLPTEPKFASWRSGTPPGFMSDSAAATAAAITAVAAEEDGPKQEWQQQQQQHLVMQQQQRRQQQVQQQREREQQLQLQQQQRQQRGGLQIAWWDVAELEKAMLAQSQQFAQQQQQQQQEQQQQAVKDEPSETQEQQPQQQQPQQHQEPHSEQHSGSTAQKTESPRSTSPHVQDGGHVWGASEQPLDEGAHAHEGEGAHTQQDGAHAQQEGAPAQEGAHAKQEGANAQESALAQGGAHAMRVDGEERQSSEGEPIDLQSGQLQHPDHVQQQQQQHQQQPDQAQEPPTSEATEPKSPVQPVDNHTATHEEQQRRALSWEEQLRLHYESLSPGQDPQVARPTVTTSAAPVLPW